MSEAYFDFKGKHVLGELYGISYSLLNDAEHLTQLLKEGIEKSGATLCNLQSKVFSPSGVTLLALLSESHTSEDTHFISL